MIKKALVIVCAAIAAVFTGCKSIPTPAQLETASFAIGASTGLVCNMTKISDKDRQVIIEIMNEVKYCMPTAGQTVVEAWTDVAKAYVKKLIDAKEITEIEGALILKTFDTVASAVDYMIRIRWPQIGQYTDLMLAATHGFCDGFLTAFKPANNKNGTFAAPVRVEYDVDAYNYLMSLKR